MKKLFLSPVFILFFCSILNGQQGPKIYGHLKAYKTRTLLCGAEVNIYSNGELIGNMVTKSDGEFGFVLEPGFCYTISFNKNQFYSKCVEIDMSNYVSNIGWFEMSTDVDLIYAYDPNIDSLFLEPIGISQYNYKTDMMDWNYDYIEAIRGKYDSLAQIFDEQYVLNNLFNREDSVARSCIESNKNDFGIYSRMHEYCLERSKKKREVVDFKGISESTEPIYRNESTSLTNSAFDNIMKTGDALIKEQKYMEALELFEYALKKVPENSLLKKKIKRLMKLLDKE